MPYGASSNTGGCLGNCTTIVDIGDESNASNLHFLIGTFPFGPDISISLLNGTDANISSRFGTFTLTYNYTPIAPAPVPEATTWTAMLLGFVGLGVVSYSRSRKRTALAA